MMIIYLNTSCLRRKIQEFLIYNTQLFFIHLACKKKRVHIFSIYNEILFEYTSFEWKDAKIFNS